MLKIKGKEKTLTGEDISVNGESSVRSEHRQTVFVGEFGNRAVQCKWSSETH